MSNGTCKFDGCDNPVRHRALRCCYRCYRYLLVWRDRHPQEKRDRLTQLVSLNSRMEYMLAGQAMPVKKKTKRPSNVVRLQKRGAS